MDEHAITELDLYITNDGDLYRRMTQRIEKNMRRKWDKGTYSQELAVKGWMHLVDEGARLYVKEFCGANDPKPFSVFPKAERTELAKRFEARFRAEMEIAA